jgi:hypothetical protein
VAIEEVIDPAQPLVDAHHHLWKKPGWRYLYDELLADLDCGHNIRATIAKNPQLLSRSEAAGGDVMTRTRKLGRSVEGPTMPGDQRI